MTLPLFLLFALLQCVTRSRCTSAVVSKPRGNEFGSKVQPSFNSACLQLKEQVIALSIDDFLQTIRQQNERTAWKDNDETVERDVDETIEGDNDRTITSGDSQAPVQESDQQIDDLVPHFLSLLRSDTRLPDDLQELPLWRRLLAKLDDNLLPVHVQNETLVLDGSDAARAIEQLGLFCSLAKFFDSISIKHSQWDEEATKAIQSAISARLMTVHLEDCSFGSALDFSECNLLVSVRCIESNARLESLSPMLTSFHFGGIVSSETLADFIEGHTQLQTLGLPGIQFSSPRLADAILRLPNLASLDLSGGSFASMFLAKVNSPLMLARLKHLDISYCSNIEFSDTVLTQLFMLESLSVCGPLDKMKIASLASRLFYLRKLRRLHLDWNNEDDGMEHLLEKVREICLLRRKVDCHACTVPCLHDEGALVVASRYPQYPTAYWQLQYVTNASLSCMRESVLIHSSNADSTTLASITELLFSFRISSCYRSLFKKFSSLQTLHVHLNSIDDTETFGELLHRNPIEELHLQWFASNSNAIQAAQMLGELALKQLTLHIYNTLYTIDCGVFAELIDARMWDSMECLQLRSIPVQLVALLLQRVRAPRLRELTITLNDDTRWSIDWNCAFRGIRKLSIVIEDYKTTYSYNLSSLLRLFPAVVDLHLTCVGTVGKFSLLGIMDNLRRCTIRCGSVNDVDALIGSFSQLPVFQLLDINGHRFAR